MKKKQKFIRKKITVACIGIAALILLVGCGNKNSTAGEKQTVTLAGINLDDHVRTQAEEFNQSQDSYTIEIKDYAEYENPTDQLNLDIISGEVPDLLDVSYLDYDRYISKDLLCDLNTFMEQDEELNRDVFFENVLEAMEEDGKLYYIMPFFTVGGLMGRTEDIENGMSLSELKEQEAKYGADARAFYYSNESVLNLLMESNYKDFVDWKQGTCSFDSDEFKELLSYAATYPDEQTMYNDDSSRTKKMQSHEILYSNLNGTVDLSELMVYKEIMGGSIDFMGYPSAQKSGIMIEQAFSSFALSITSGSEVKEGAWEFLKQLMSREYCVDQMEEYFTDGFPLRKDVFEDVVRKYTATEEYTDEYGHEISPVEGSLWLEGIEVETNPLKEEDIADVRKMIERIDHSGANASSPIMDIIEEESMRYFAGERDVDNTAETIQNRVSVYISEQE
jgi:ABC-type glycerol-3-phosphate transport system substrate-binding protein